MATITRGERIQAFLFVLIGLAVSVVVVLILVGQPFGEPTDVYYLRFTEPVTGLDSGTPVRYKGVPFGKISDIDVNPRNPEEILIKLQLDRSAPVKVSTTAHIVAESILGPYVVDLRESRITSPPLPPGSDIPASSSTLGRLLETGETVGARLIQVLDNLEAWTSSTRREEFWTLIDEITVTLRTVRAHTDELAPEALELMRTWRALGYESGSLIAENRAQVRLLLQDLAASAARLRLFLEEGELERLSETATATLNRVAAELERDGAALRQFLEESNLSEFLERSVASIERIAEQVSATAGTLEAEGIQLLRAEIAPAWRELRIAAASLARLLEVVERNPRALLFGEPEQERRIPGSGR